MLNAQPSDSLAQSLGALNVANAFSLQMPKKQGFILHSYTATDLHSVVSCYGFCVEYKIEVTQTETVSFGETWYWLPQVHSHISRYRINFGDAVALGAY